MARFLTQQTLKHILFWLLLFAAARILFLLYNQAALATLPLSDILLTFIYALRLDISTVCYFLSISFLLFFVYSLILHRLIIYIHTAFVFLFILVFTIIGSADAILFNEWGHKINYKALTYVVNPSEVINSVRWSVTGVGICCILLLSGAAGYLYIRFVQLKKTVVAKRSYLVSIIFFLFFPIILVIGLRGGLQEIPVNQSNACFSDKNILNSAAVNPLWNLGQSIDQNYRYMGKNPYTYFPDRVAADSITKLHQCAKDSTEMLFTSARPNIVLIILEGWSADVVASLNGMPAITPEFDKLCKEGYLFNHCYASGTLSDQGIVALLSGFPAQPTTRIVRQPDKYIKLPYLSQQLKQANYISSFYFGGELNYGNIKGYLYASQFDKIIEGNDLPTAWPQGKLGIHDGYMLDYHISELNKSAQPFFSALFTVSSHSPYDQPMQEKFISNQQENAYVNSVYYADSCIGNYIRKAKQQSWYKNTVFIFISDHSHHTPLQRNYHDPLQRRIPWLIYGEPLKKEYAGKKQERIVSQVDFASTLLHQLQLPSTYVWSKNSMNPYTPEFAYYTFTDGVGWVTPGYQFAYDHIIQQYMFSQKTDPTTDTVQTIKQGKAYLQMLFSQYLWY